MKRIFITLCIIACILPALGQEYFTPWSYNVKYIYKTNGMHYIMPKWSNDGQFISFVVSDTLFIYNTKTNSYVLKQQVYSNCDEVLWNRPGTRIMAFGHSAASFVDIKSHKVKSISLKRRKDDIITPLYWYDNDNILVVNYNRYRDTLFYYDSRNYKYKDQYIPLDSSVTQECVSPDGQYLLGTHRNGIGLCNILTNQTAVLYKNTDVSGMSWCDDSRSFLFTHKDYKWLSRGYIDEHGVDTLLVPQEQSVNYMQSPDNKFVFLCTFFNSIFTGLGPYEGHGGLIVADTRERYHADIVWLCYYAEWSPSSEYIVVATTKGVGIVNWRNFAKKYRMWY